MSNFPNNFDDDTTLPYINDNIQDAGGEAINALREAMFNVQDNIGLTAAGNTGSISNRLDSFLFPDGSIKPSAIASLGLVTLPITNAHISDSAQIPEYKLKLDHKTQNLYNYIQDLSVDIKQAISWISTTGIKLDPHVEGAAFKHSLNHINVSTDPNLFFKNKYGLFRNNDDAYELVNDINNELLLHQFADGLPTGNINYIQTNNGSLYPDTHAHTASGIYLDTSRFVVIPQTANDLQQLAEFLDSSSIFLYGTRIQNLYSNGISRVSRSSSLLADGYGTPIIPYTTATTYLLNTNSESAPFDDIDYGDDIVEFFPSPDEISSNSFDSKFASVRIGDIIRINYGSIELQFIIKETKYSENGGNKKFVVRINGKNIAYTTEAKARIDKPLFNNNKRGALAVSAVNNTFSEIPSLIVGSPRGAQVLGSGFNPNQLNSTHYLLYLTLYPNGNPVESIQSLPPIDVTGNAGATPGKYTLQSVVDAVNAAFRQPGFNFRFIAFSYRGEFGIMLADSYNNAGFSILSAVIDDNGNYDQTITESSFPNNVIDIFADGIGKTGEDALGFGPRNSNVASPLFQSVYASAAASLLPTKIFLPLKRNNYYVNGIEKEKLSLEPFQRLDRYGEGYWAATVVAKNIFPGPPPNGRVQVTYRIDLDLSTSNLKVGKTLVVQPPDIVNSLDPINYGRFIIESLNVSCGPNSFTDITVYDAVHAFGSSPTDVIEIGEEVALYFNSDSVSFNEESATDFSSVQTFKRYFELYITQLGHTFTHERGRANISGSNQIINGVTLYTTSELQKINIVKISPKLRGYQFGVVNKITLHISNYDSTTETFKARLGYYDGGSLSKFGNSVYGKKGEVARVYDETNIDFVDILFDFEQSISSFSDHYLDIQMFPTLSLDDEIMLIGGCQVNDITKKVAYLSDERQFGNTGEKDLTTSALNFIALPEKLLHGNGVIRGFDLVDGYNPIDNQIYLNGGVVLVDGKILQINNGVACVPKVKELYNAILYNINWVLCINNKSEYQTIPLLEYDNFLSTPSNDSRAFVAYDPISAESYIIEATTFKDLITRRKDLTPLYVIRSEVGLIESDVTTGTLTLQDIRRYVNDGEFNFPIVLTSETIQGNFRSFDSVLAWIKYNNAFNTHVLVRGDLVLDSPQVLDFSDLGRTVIFEGDGGSIYVTSDKGIVLGSFVTLKNLHFIFRGLNPELSDDNTINNGHGLIYSELNDGEYIKDSSIENCTFSLDNDNGRRYSYVNINISNANTYIQNLKIADNKFYTPEESAFCAAVAIVNTAIDINVNHSIKLDNVLIDRNICDRDQIIVLTSIKNENVPDFEGNPNNYADPLIFCKNVKISNNICGAIGTLTTSMDVDGYVASNNILYIENNTCNYITNLNDKGKFLSIRNQSLGDAGQSYVFTHNSGNVIIESNKTSFIHYSMMGDATSNSQLRIQGNILNSNIGISTPKAEDYLSNFNYTTSPITLSKRYAILLDGAASGCIVDGNMIDCNAESGYDSYIRTEIVANITNNVFKGIKTIPEDATTDHEYSAIVYDALGHGVITGNKIHRDDKNIFAYVSTKYLLSSTSTKNIRIVENIFDSSTVDGTDIVICKDGIGTDLSSYWAVERNINQIQKIEVRSLVGQHAWGNLLYPLLARPVIIGSTPSGMEISLAHNSSLAEDNISFTYDTSEASGEERNYFWWVDLTDILPLNTYIIKIESTASCNVVLSNTDTTVQMKLIYNDSILGTATVDFDSPYVAFNKTPLTITPSNSTGNKNLNDVKAHAALIMHFKVKNNADINVNSGSVVITYRW